MARAGGKDPSRLPEALDAAPGELLRRPGGVKVLALDHGPARTGVAVSDPTGTIARPLPAIARVDSPAGRARLDALIAERGARRASWWGSPRSMSGERGEQARAARASPAAARAGSRRRWSWGRAADHGRGRAPRAARAARGPTSTAWPPACCWRPTWRRARDGAPAAPAAAGAARRRPAAAPPPPAVALAAGAGGARAILVIAAVGRVLGRRGHARPRRATVPPPVQRDLDPRGPAARGRSPPLLDPRDPISGAGLPGRSPAPAARGRAPRRARDRPTSLEGFLFPATYEITGAPRWPTLVDEQLAAYQDNTADVDYAYAPLAEPHQVRRPDHRVDDRARGAVTRASGALVAGVIYNRLQAGMRARHRRDRASTRSARGRRSSTDVRPRRCDSPYNTRRFVGPAARARSATRGSTASRAAAHPARTAVPLLRGPQRRQRPPLLRAHAGPVRPRHRPLTRQRGPVGACGVRARACRT